MLPLLFIRSFDGIIAILKLNFPTWVGGKRISRMKIITLRFGLFIFATLITVPLGEFLIRILFPQDLS